IDFPDGRRRVLERDLRSGVAFDTTGFRRYQLLVAPGRVALGHVDAVEQRASSGIDLGRLKQQLAAASRDDEPASARTLEQSTGTLAHYLLALRFAAESDALSDRIAWVNGVALVHHQPRLLLTSTDAGQAADEAVAPSVSFDLRLDEVLALPYPGFPIRTAVLFQAARGMQESVLEGALLAELNQDADSLSTARYMERALAERIPLQVLSHPAEASAALPLPVRSRIDAALTRGARIVIPEHAVEIDGRARWGWWQIDSGSGALVGVMDNGLHAGMTEYSLDLSKIALDDRMGMAIGAILGATSTHITIAALILEHGEFGPGLAEAVTKILEKITCLSCPGAKASASAGAGASASVSIADDCLSESESIGVGGEVGVGIKVGSFCDAYVQGFKCASGLILNGLTTKISTSANAGFERTLSFGCD
ncbi:MAG: hypothetical protein RQ826_12985, partial [Xanthomonadales bacterium]|nr:hypothetical protein [Xanthomonadales bacterium]